jgi:hypothetical protein
MQDTPSARDLARQLREWINSDEGQREIFEILAKAEASTAELAQARRLDPAMLQEQFTL